jgi:beta-lactamase class A
MTLSGANIEPSVPPGAGDVTERIRDVFSAAGARGYLHARELGRTTSIEVDVDADEPVVMGSVFKIAVAVAFARAVEDELLDETERATITSRYRIGGTGTAGYADDVEMSWRDIALSMMTISDNAATDTLFNRLGQPAVDAVLADLDLSRTRIVGCCEDLFASMSTELGFDIATPDSDELLAQVPDDKMWSLSALDPLRTSASTPRDITRFLEAIWSDRAASPAACERVRAIMSQQIWPHRLASGFEGNIRYAAKTGTMPGIRNEVGVIGFPDGRNFAVAVFTRADSLGVWQPPVDRSIGLAGRLAVDFLRS